MRRVGAKLQLAETRAVEWQQRASEAEARLVVASKRIAIAEEELEQAKQCNADLTAQLE